MEYCGGEHSPLNEKALKTKNNPMETTKYNLNSLLVAEIQ